MGRIQLPESRRSFSQHDTRYRQQLSEVAWRRAEAKNRALFFKNKQRAKQVDLDEMYRSVEQKKAVVQQMTNRAVGLGWLCQENIDLVCNNFATSVRHDLIVFILCGFYIISFLHFARRLRQS